MDQGPYIPQPDKPFQFSAIQCAIFCGFILLGLVLKVQHWPGSALFILAASGGLAGYNFVAFLLLRGKHVANNIFLVVEALWVLVLLYGLLWNNGHPYNEYGVMIHIGAFIITAAINSLAFRKYFSNSV